MNNLSKIIDETYDEITETYINDDNVEAIKIYDEWFTEYKPRLMKLQRGLKSWVVSANLLEVVVANLDSYMDEHMDPYEYYEDPGYRDMMTMLTSDILLNIIFEYGGDVPMDSKRKVLSGLAGIAVAGLGVCASAVVDTAIKRSNHDGIPKIIFDLGRAAVTSIITTITVGGGVSYAMQEFKKAERLHQKEKELFGDS